MAELTTRDGGPPPTVPTGEVTCTRLPDDSIRIDAADPRVLISAELLDAIADGGSPHWHSWLDTTECAAGYGYVGAVLHIDGVNRTVIYRVTDYMPHVRGYIAEWPD